MERTESGPASAPVEAHRHPARLKQVCDTDPLPQRRAKVIISSVHETRIIALRSAVTASEAGGAMSPGSSGAASATSIKVDWGSAYSRTVQSADPRRQGRLQRCIASIASGVEGLLCQLEHGCPSHRLLGCQVEQGENDAGRPCSALPVRQRLLKRRYGRIMDASEDAGAGFRLTRRPAHNDTRGTDLENAQLRRANVVAIEAASRPQSTAGVQAAVRVLILKLEMLKDLDQPILDAEANWKALVERGAGYPLRDDQERGGHGLVSRQLHRGLPPCLG